MTADSIEIANIQYVGCQILRKFSILGPKTTWSQNFYMTIVGLLVAFSSIFKHFQAFSSIFAVAQRAFTVGFEILKCSYLKILKNVSFRSLDLIVACSSMVL